VTCHRHSWRRIGCAVATATLIGCTTPSASETQFLPKELGDWQLDYSVSGGLSFSAHALTVSRSGELRAVDTRLGDDVRARASQDVLKDITRFLSDARPARSTSPQPDAISAALVLKAGGRQYELALNETIQSRLDAAWDKAVAEALVGSWRESGWTLCRPAAVLTAADMDTPIDDLTFQRDGRFTLVWRGGGPETADIPHVHVDVPDYTGTYAVTPTTGAMKMHSTSPLVSLRDFSGDGQFQIKGTELTLTRIWLGTRTAARKPDICALAFTRK
jgi:hypothetical protein